MTKLRKDLMAGGRPIRRMPPKHRLRLATFNTVHFLPLASALLLAPAIQAGTNFVTATGSGDGSSWPQASSLTNALTTAGVDDQIWLAEGTYTNSTPFTISTDNLTLYGGLTNGMATLAERNWDVYPTLLDGQSARRVMSITGTNTTLDGLVITNGYGANTTISAGGIYSTAAGISLANCTVTDNSPRNAMTRYGGGAYFNGGSVSMTNCAFANNKATHWSHDGIGFYAYNTTIDIVDCRFINNRGLASQWYQEGGAIRAYGGTLTVKNSTFIGNHVAPANYSNGGGAAAFIAGNCTASFTNCMFKNNMVHFYAGNRECPGGALYVYNTGAAQVTLDHCSFLSNTGTYGGAIYLRDGSLSVENCTLTGNRARDTGNIGQGGAIHNEAGDLTIHNSILWTNTAETRAADISRISGSATISYSCLSGDHTDSAFIYDAVGDISKSFVFSQDPLFAGATDIHLKSTAGRWDGASFVTTDPLPFSPCIDAGDPATSVGDEVAANGGCINLGRWGGSAEASKSSGNSSKVETRSAITNGGNVATMRGELVDIEVIASVRIYYTTNTLPTNAHSYVTVYPPQQTGTVFGATTVGLDYNTTYYYRCYATNAYGEDWANTTINFTTGPKGTGGPHGVIHVKADATGSETGDTWDNAYTSLKDGAAAVTAGTNEIWVAAGTYDDDTVDISATCSIYGGFNGTETNRAARDPEANAALVDGAAVRRCISISDGNVILDGLIITNARHNAHGCGLNAGSGVDDLQLINCTFTHNEASVSHINGGGAAFVSCPVLMTNCLFEGNFSAIPSTIWYQSGGGFYASGADVTIVDCVFTNNGNDDIGSRDAFLGGAFYAIGGSLDVSDSVITDNKFYGKSGSFNGGGGGRLSGVNPAHFTRCLFEGNYIWSTSDGRTTSGGGLLIEGGSSDVTIDHCIFDGNYCVQNDSQGGAICVAAGSVSVTNCTFVNNRTDDQGGALHVYGGNIEIQDSIFYSNAAAIRGHDISLEPGGSALISYCRTGGDKGSDWIYDGAAGITTDNIVSDEPRFAGGNDVHLRSKAGRWDPVTGLFTNDTETSLLIDAGDPGGGFGQEQAPNGGRVNLGRYGNTVEASKTFAVAPIVMNLGYSVTNNYVILQGQLIDNEAVASVGFYYGLSDRTNDISGWDAFLSLPGQFASGSLFSNAVGDLLYNVTYYFRAFTTNSLGFDFADNVMTFSTGSKPPGGPDGTLHVKVDAPGSQSGATWFDAFHTVLEAVNKVNGPLSNEIWVASGFAQRGGTLAIGTNANIYGGFTGTTETNRAERDVSANVTVLDGEGVRRVVNISDGTVLLDGLTITNGHASTGAGIYASGHDTLTLANCQIIDNHHGDNGCNGAGARFSGGSVLITNTTFADNSASYGGGSIGYAAGISAHSVNMIILDSLFRSNSLENIVVRDGEGGGAIWANHGTLAVTNTTFVGNRGNQASVNTRGGGACFLKGALTATFKNCAFVGNVCAAPTYPTRIPSGGALQVAVSSGYTVTLENCSIGHGSAHGDGGAIIARSGELIIKNSILWTNEITGSGSGKEIYVTGASTIVSNQYSIYTGTNSTYVTINSGTVNWGPGDITYNPLFASSSDLHLQSKAGRWDPTATGGAGGWVRDPATSPAIDAGDPLSPFGNEPVPRGKRINLGAYGGTPEASKTQQAGSVLMFR